MDLTSLSTIHNLAQAQQHLEAAKSWKVQGDQAADVASAVSLYRRSTGEAETAALIATTVTQVLAGLNPALAPYDAAATNEAQSATASVSDAGQTSDRATAQQAAAAGVAAATQGLAYATQANKLWVQPPRVTLGATGILLGLAGLAGLVGYFIWRRQQTEAATVLPAAVHA